MWNFENTFVNLSHINVTKICPLWAAMFHTGKQTCLQTDGRWHVTNTTIDICILYSIAIKRHESQ